MSIQPTLIGLLDDSVKFQYLMDNIAGQFDPPVWPKYLTDKVTLRLEWRAILGVLEATPMASVIDFSSGKPVAIRPTVSKLAGELATFGNKYQMDKKEVRDFYDLQNMVGQNGITEADLIEFLYPDLKRASLGPHKTIDMLLLEAMSTGVMSLSAVKNPKGVIWNENLDWGIDQNTVVTVWTNVAATPLVDIRAVVDEWINKGVEFKLMKMSRTTFNLMVKTTEFINAYKMELGFGSKTVKIEKNTQLGVDNVNLFMESIDLPNIEIINEAVQIENKNGTYTTLRPFADHRVSFSVDNNYGDMFRTFTNESISPNKIKTYANSLDVQISKYQDVDGNEFTEGEFNAFPVLNKANSMSILKTNVAT